MITDDGAVEFRQWPASGPEGGISVEWEGTYRANLEADWASWPPELSTALLAPQAYPYGTPRVWCGPKSEIVRYSYVGGTSGGVTWGGLFMGGHDMLLVSNLPSSPAATTFAHEWGHFVDWSYRQRIAGLTRSNLTSTDDELRQVYYDIRDAYPDSTLYYHRNIREFFAQTFAGWVKRNRAVILSVCKTEEFTQRLCEVFERIIPYEGMQQVVSPPTTQQRMRFSAAVQMEEDIGCGGVVLD